MKQGTIGQYVWGESWNEMPELLIGDVVRGLTSHLVGLRGLNVSWDSGLLLRSDSRCPPDWRFCGKHATSPPITAELAAQWPYSPCGFDEWYFFREPPTEGEWAPFCNWLGMSLEKASDLSFPGGFDLLTQLERARPEIVIGQSYSIYVIARTPQAVADFGGLVGGGAQEEASGGGEA